MSSQRRRQPRSLDPAAAAHLASANDWAPIVLLPNPLPDFSRNAVDTSLRLFGRACAVPLLLQADQATDFDTIRLAAAAARRESFLFSLGDLAPVIGDRTMLSRLVTITDAFEPATLFGEISISTLTSGTIAAPLGVGAVASAVHNLRLRALIVRLDFARAAENGHGDLDPSSAPEAINELKEAIGCPILVRATTGFPRIAARKLIQHGTSGFVAGGIERGCAPLDNDPGSSDRPERPSARPGIPAAAAIRMLRGIGAPIVSDARFNHGADAAKAIALGADLVAPQHVLSALHADEAGALDRWVATFASELEGAMFLAGARTLAQLRQSPFVATGETREWLEAAETLWKADPRDE
ncbi:MAG TPA: alpha-hydroxy-acid oxidizing protein [Nitrolancea sp.]|nr:alpha-hydroxy-acid oxidizing protein [Nitrolancea sp.]